MIKQAHVVAIALLSASFNGVAQNTAPAPQDEPSLDSILGEAPEVPANAAADKAQPGPVAAETAPATADTAAAPDTAKADSGAIPVQKSAQPPDGKQASKPKASSRLVEEIIVTAQKREESVQDVPISIAAFSAAKLDASGIQSTNDLPSITPGLTISGSAGYSLIYLRGIGTSAFIPSFDPSVATYVDGIYIPSQQATLTDLGGVQRVEILKGPQGTLFGRNSTGGAINVITKSPGSSPELSASVDLSNFNGRKVKFYGSYPITDTLAVSLSGIYSTRDSYYSVVPDPRSLSAPPDYSLRPETARGGRVKLHWKPTDDLSLELAAYRVLQKGSAAFTEPNVKPAPITGIPINAAGDYETSANTEPTSNSITTAYYGVGMYSTHWLDIKLLAADQDQNSYDNVYDFDGGQPNIAIFNGPHEPSQLQTAELQFLSNDKGWTPHWLKWIAGAYFLHQKAGFDPFFATVGDVVGLVPNLPPALNLGNGLVSLGAFGILETRSYSGFVQSTASFTDWLALTLGARYQLENRFLTKQNTTTEVLDTGAITTLQFHQPKVDQKNISPKATLELRPADGLLLYGTWTRGYKSGSYNIVTLYTIPDYVEPERVTTYELGAKISAISGLTLNLAAFTNSIHNLQETKLSLLSGGAISAENAGAARTRGGEFDAVWIPFQDSNSGFVVSGGATYLDAVYTDYQKASGFNEVTGLPFGSGTPFPGQDFSGHRIARTPKFSGNFALSQTVDIPGGPLELAGDVYYNDGFYFSAQNTQATLQKSYALLNARVSYLYEQWGVRLTGFVRNIASTKYAETSLTVDFGTFQRLAPPRTFGLTLGYDFH